MKQTTGPVRVWQVRRRDSRPVWQTRLLVGTVLSGAIGVIVGGGWLAVQLILNPGRLTWLSHLLPIGGVAESSPQTLAEIAAEVQQQGQAVGPIVYFNSAPHLTPSQLGFNDLLLPIVQPLKACSDDTCQPIVELRVYRPQAARFPQTYILLDRIGITPPEELTVIAPLSRSSPLTQGSTRSLPLTQIHWITGPTDPAPPGLWFHLSGEWKRGSRVLYGQVIQYDPQQARLHVLQNWSSVAGKLPVWQPVTGDRHSELVVDQSIGLEPQFQVFQLQFGRVAQSLTLEPISLAEVDGRDRTYANTLLLARHGLWATALTRLKTAQQQGHWPANAQAQADLIKLHAAITHSQADRDWASPTQQILAQLMDDRWSEALNSVKTAHRSGYDVKNWLTTHADSLWQRLEAALRVNPSQSDLQQWGALVLAIRQTPAQATAWFDRQPRSTSVPEATSEAASLLALLQPPPDGPRIAAARPTAVPVASPPLPAARPLTGLIGSITPIATFQPADWIAVQPPVQLNTQQRWYQINAIALQEHNFWQQTLPPLSSKPTAAIVAPTPLQLISWQGATPIQTVTVQLQALRWRNDRLELLVVSEPLRSVDRSVSLAITPDSLHWTPVLSTHRLHDLIEQQPDWQQTLLPQLWQTLQTAQLIGSDLPMTEWQTAIGDWSVQTMELTGEGNPEYLLTIATTAAAAPRSLIFASNGQLLYRDLTEAQTLVTIAEPASDQLPPILILEQSGSLHLQQWSAARQQFEPQEP